MRSQCSLLRSLPIGCAPTTRPPSQRHRPARDPRRVLVRGRIVSDCAGGDAMTKVAILPTGRMGGAIARRLAASGIDLAVWDRPTGSEHGLNAGRVAPTPAAAIRAADLVISSLPNAAAVRDG